ncbi:MAG TPA: TonB family protein [Gammaproteobacteria bacterium]|jgi:TonB family protein|nr:TonB family protein [Gammaproteobacteria bacterium]
MKGSIGILLALSLVLTGCAPKHDDDTALITGDYKTALARYQAEAAQGNSAAEMKLADMYTQGLGVPADPAAGLRWDEKAANDGNYSAIIQVSNYYVLPHDGRVDYAQAFKWCKVAVDAGDNYCWLWLSIYYENGLGVQRNHEQALYWLEKFKTMVKVPSSPSSHKESAPSESEVCKVAVDIAIRTPGSHIPGGAQSTSGVVYVNFSDTDGRATDVAVAKSSGDPVVDAAAVDLVQRAYLPPLLPSLQRLDHLQMAFQYGNQPSH